MNTISNELYETTYKDQGHFSFGKNWQNFLKKINKEKIKEAEQSLVEFLGGYENIKDKTFLDIGCGSGLFSLAAHQLGAKQVVSVDADQFSVACTKYLHTKAGSQTNWKIHHGSVLDKKFLATLGTFDIVYSWGVLHHTGNMYEAFSAIIPTINHHGKLYIAIYNDNKRILEGTSSFWRKLKKFYNQSSKLTQSIILYTYTCYYLCGLILHGINPFIYAKNYKSLRGMDFTTDIQDWIGGYPYEFASSEEIISYFQKLGFTCEKSNPARSIGCNEFLFKRIS